MNILYISQYFPPEMGAPAARVSELARYWVQAGHEVTVLTGFPNHPTGIVHPQYRKRLRRLIWQEDTAGVRVVRTWLLPFPNRKPHERILNYTSFCLSSCLTGMFLGRPDVIIATTPQLLVGLTGWWLSRIKRAPFVLEVRDIWPDSITASGVGNQGSLFIRSLRRLARFLYRSCSHIVVVTPAFKEELITKWAVMPEKISIVENGVDIDLFTPDRETDTIKDVLGIRGKFVVAYIGTLGLAHGLSTVLQAASRLQKSVADILFLLVGEGTEKQRLISQTRDQGLSNVRFLPQQPREKIPSLIRASDLCLVLLKKRAIFKTVIPTKMLEFMACGRPVVLGVDGQARKLLEEAQAGIFVEPEDPKALAEAIVQLYHDRKLCQILGQNGRCYIVNRLSREKTARLYIHVLEKALTGCKRNKC